MSKVQFAYPAPQLDRVALKRLQHADHRPRLVKHADAHEAVHGAGRLGQINQAIAVAITKRVGTMWCAYLFAVLGTTGIVAAMTNNTTLVLLVGAVSGYFLQLVLLPIIIVGQNVQAAASDARAEADHDTLVAIHGLAAGLNSLLEQNTDLTDEVHRLSVEIRGLVAWEPDTAAAQAPPPTSETST